jgi:TP901 family phage tail tape measure protein
MASLAQTIEILFNATDNTGGAFSGIGGKLTSLDASIQGIAAPFASLADMILKTETAVVALGAAFIGTSLASAGEFGNKIKEISTVAGTTDENMAKFSGQILQYGTVSSKSISDINESVYQAISAGIDYSHSLEFLKVAEDLAVGGRGQLSDVTNSLIGSMNAYGVSNKDAGAQIKIAGDYADAMFIAVQKGVVTIPELSQQLGDVTSTASASGVSFDTLLAAIAAVTASGVPAAQAVTSINQALSSIIKPSSEAAKEATALGIAFDAESLKDQGFPTFMRNLQTATGGSVEKLSLLFGNVEALKSVLILAADKTGIFSDTLNMMADKSGTAARSAETMAVSWENASQRLKNSAYVVFVTFGQEIGGEAGKGLDGIAKIFNAFTVSINAGAFDPVFRYLNEIAVEINATAADIAKNLPEALSNVDFSGLLGSFSGLGDSLKSAFEAVFGKVDLSTPEGVQAVIQDVINGIQTLTEITTGIVESFKPYLLMLGDIIKRTEGMGTDSNDQVGKILGFAKAIENLGISITLLGNVLGDDKNSINRFFTGSIGFSKSFIEALGVTIDYIKLFVSEINLIELKTNLFNPFGDSAENTAQQIKQAEEKIAALNLKIDAGWEGAVSGWDKFGNAVMGNSDQAVVSVSKVKTATDELNTTIGSSAGKFKPIDTSEFDNEIQSLDYVGAAMERMGLATHSTQDEVNAYVDSLIAEGMGFDGAKIAGEEYEKTIVALWGRTVDATKSTSAYSAEVSKVTLPDGMIKITDSLGDTSIKFDYTRKTAEGYFDTIKDGAGNVIDHIWIPTQAKASEAVKGTAAELAKAQKAADDYALKLLEAGNKIKISGMETWGKINMAQIEADTKQVEAAFKSIDNTITTTGKGITDLWGLFTKIDGFDQSGLLDSIRQQEKIQLDAAGKQNELLDAQIALVKARADSLNRGDAVITVNANGLKSHLELIFGEILKETQVKASEQGLQLLLGFSP